MQELLVLKKSNSSSVLSAIWIPSGLGTPKPDDIPMMIAKAAYIDNIRLNPDRYVVHVTCLRGFFGFFFVNLGNFLLILDWFYMEFI